MVKYMDVLVYAGYTVGPKGHMERNDYGILEVNVLQMSQFD